MANKPSWDDAPEWANYLAIDESGVWYWYSDAPIWSDDRWITGTLYEVAEAVPVEAEQTLEARP